MDLNKRKIYHTSYYCGLVLLMTLLTVVTVNGNVEENEEFCHPQHVHIAYGDSLKEMVIMWATKGNCSTVVEYGKVTWSLIQQAAGDSVQYFEQNAKGLQYLHRTKLTDLASSSTYFYHPLSNDIGAGPFYFQTPRTDQNWSPEFLVFGDLGIHTETIPTLVEEALKGEYTALLHVGDFAYDLKHDEGLVGDKFMELIEPVAAFLPYMTAPGNHEIDNDTFTHYRHRFSMPQSPWPMSVDNLWYSFGIGPVHFISYSTEVFFTLNGEMVEKQRDWLIKDLKKANTERANRPWIIAFGHRPMYCSAKFEECTNNQSLVRAGLEDIFYHYGVDIVLEAHEHNYERLYPVYKEVVLSTSYVNPQAPVQIISGAAGSKGGTGAFQNPDKPEWTAIRLANDSLNSYGHLRVVNTSHVYWEQRSIHNHAVLDSLWIIQYTHGKFAIGNLPSSISQEIGNIHHPEFPDDNDETLESKEELEETDNTVRLVIGISFAVIFLVLLIVFLVTKVFRRRRYRIVRRWSPEDLEYDKKLKAGHHFMEDLEMELESADMGQPSKKLLRGS